MKMRDIALRLLIEYESGERYVNLSLSSHIADSLSDEARGQLTALLYTTVEHKLTYDYLIGALSGRSFDEVDYYTRAILRLGLCQIIDMSSIPDYAAVNETVKLARNSGERAFVNGVLRRAVREKGALPYPKREKSLPRYLSVAYSIPLPTVKYFISRLGECEAERLFAEFNREQPLTLTVNTAKISVDDYMALLESEGYTATRAKFSPLSLRISESVSPRRLPGFDEGLFIVQDEASAIAATLAARGRDTFTVDVCSAPGGKAATAAIMGGEVLALDLHDSKLSLIEKTARRLGLDGAITVRQNDARQPIEQLFGSADSVICDVPCSGLGVIAKKPDLRYKSLEDMKELPTLQLEILTASVKYLRVGGRIVYSTCTLRSEENEEVVSAFLEANHDYALVPFAVGELSSRGMTTLYPHIHGTDGFFIAVMEKLR